MNSAADMGRHSGRATPSLHDAPYRQSKEATGRRSTYPLPIPVQTNPATSLNRKNALFAGSDEGGDNWAVIATLIECCKLNAINPNEWLTETLACLANGRAGLTNPDRALSGLST